MFLDLDATHVDGYQDGKDAGGLLSDDVSIYSDTEIELEHLAQINDAFDDCEPETMPESDVMEALLFPDEQPVAVFEELKNQVLETIFPVGHVLIETTGTNPGTTYGIGTWTATSDGRYLVGYKSGDADFGTGGATGGSKTHTHDVNPNSETSGGPSATTTVDTDGTGSTVAVASALHTHDTDISNTTSGDNSEIPSFQVFYVWERTA